MPKNLPLSDASGNPPTGPTNVPVQAPISLLPMLGTTLSSAWQPRQIRRPEVRPRLTELSAIERSSEVLRFKLLQLEYALSSGGGLRAWLKLNLLMCVLIGIPSLLVIPVVTWLLSAFTSWSEFLFRTALNVLYTMLTVAAIVVVVMAIIYGIKAFTVFTRKRGSDQRWRRR